MKRRTLIGTAAAATVAPTAFAQDASEKIRKINFYTWPQAALPQAYQASQLIAQEWRKLGLDIDVKPLQRQAQTALIWYGRDKWDTTMWRMVGRPERSDPDEFVYSLFYSTYAEKGYDFIGYKNPEYDKLADKQRTQINKEERRKTIFEAQKMIDRDQPYAFLVHPKYPQAFNKAVFKEDTVVNQTGIGIRNIWTFVGIQPIGAQKDLIINSNEVINATNPLYIGGAVDSWVTDLIWDRVMRIGPDGQPQPWAAESVEWKDDTTIDIKLRAGMKWHDGQPVTLDDVIFSFTAPAGDKAPMYRPFVTEIASMEKTGDLALRMKLKAPNAAFFTASLSKINLIPKHVWEPVLKGLEGKPENAEQIKDINRTGSRPSPTTSTRPRSRAGSCASCPTPRRRSAC
jgi:peptide/nickel transport system substrate-binding protein